MIRTEQLLDLPVPEVKGPLPGPMQAHIDSLGALVAELTADEQIDPALGLMLGHFAVMHDIGYSVTPEGLHVPSTQLILTEVLDGVGASAGTDDVLEFFDQTQDNPLAGKVIGHGLAGIPKMVELYTKWGLSHDKALGLATLFASHHPGYPIDFVTTLVPAGAVPDELRSALLIDMGGDSEKMRARLMSFGNTLLHADKDTTDRLALLGYGLDRMTPARKPDAITLQGDQAVTQGGEVVDKKYGLVTGNLLQLPGSKPTIAMLYSKVELMVGKEAAAAVAAALAAKQEGVANLIEAKSTGIVRATSDAQGEALTVLDHLHLIGSFDAAADEIKRLREHVQSQDTPDPAALYALATYQQVLAEVNKQSV